jgi:hypothetical protein
MIMSLDAIRVATRTLRKQPVFTAVVVLSLGLVIALNTTMYAVLDALIHPRVDIRDPASLYRIQGLLPTEWVKSVRILRFPAACR